MLVPGLKRYATVATMPSTDIVGNLPLPTGGHRTKFYVHGTIGPCIEAFNRLQVLQFCSLYIAQQFFVMLFVGREAFAVLGLKEQYIK